MTDPIGKSFAIQLDEVRRYIREQWAWPSPEAGFARYVFDIAGRNDVLPDFTGAPWPSPLNHAPSLAAAGYLLALSESPADVDERKWADALERLSSTDPFPVDRQSFANRPIELLGIALGATRCSNLTHNAREWLCGVVRRLNDPEAPNDPWPCLLPGLAAFVLDVTWTRVCHRPLSEWSPEEIALARWLLDYPVDVSSLFVSSEDELESALLRRVALTPCRPADVARAALVHLVLQGAVSQRIESRLENTWQLTRESRDAVTLVSHLCRRFHLFAKQLLVRRESRTTLEITDEYDVQDALHALLLLHFEDVRPEEWTPSYAGSSSRMDFLLKREQVVVEAKMTRGKLGQKELANQLAVDKERYRAHEDCQTLVCLVYDPEQRCSNPTALEDDLSEKIETLRTVVIVTPKGT